MIESAARRYQRVQSLLETDREYIGLLRRQQELEPVFQAVFCSLSEPDRAILTEYLGLLAEQENRVLELACFASDAQTV